MTSKVGRRDFFKYSATSLAVGAALYSTPPWSNGAESWLGTEQKLSLPGGTKYSWSGVYNGMMAAIQTGIKEFIPGGTVLAVLFSIFFPRQSKSDPLAIWNSIKEYAEDLINEKLEEQIYKLLSSTLEGLSKEISLYQSYLSTDDKIGIRTAYVATILDFAREEPGFRVPTYELVLLPLYVQFINLYIGLLRDGVKMGASWGMSPDEIKIQSEMLTETIAKAVDHCRFWYTDGLVKVALTTPNKHWTEPFRAINRYKREMQLMVMDYVTIWPLLDLATYPDPIDIYPYLTREIYSDPLGTTDDSYPLILPSPPAGPIESISVWAWTFIGAVQVGYAPGQGPNGWTITPRMGSQINGELNKPPRGGVWKIIQNNPIVEVRGWYGDVVNGLNFIFQDGTETGAIGHCFGGTDKDCMRNGHGGPFWVASKTEILDMPYTERLSSIWINGVSNHYQCADCVVFGFKMIDPNDTGGIDIEMIKIAYITSPMTHPRNNIDNELDGLLSWLQGEKCDFKKLRRRFKKENWRLLRRKHQNYIRKMALS